ncbi:MAG TPA: alpha/beta hydrolase-fold protein [Chthonomonadaceae bacterium]|nr:alpha/beta hydrolase-fold protein [Chthonomonadaceae bacterium]
MLARFSTVVLLGCFLALSPRGAQSQAGGSPPPAAKRPHTLTGEFRMARLHSRFLTANPNRDIIVYLPPGYETEKRKRYPVLYMQDGQNLFDDATSFLGEWHMDETAQALIPAKEIAPLIIVGIYNAGLHRIDEYTPARDPKMRMGGQADTYGRMLVEELKPFIDRHYRTLKDASHTGLGGSSLGGLVSLYLGLKYPGTFGRLAVISPSVFWADHSIVRQVQTLPSKLPLRIWLDIGTAEAPDPDDARSVVQDARQLRDALIARGWRLDVDLKYVEAEGAKHNEQAWAQRVPNILKFLYPYSE